MLKKSGGKWVLRGRRGQLQGRHKTRKGAIKQMRAIYAAKARRR